MTNVRDPRYRRLAAACMAEQLDQLHAQLEGVRDARDVECVHQARVASRRLRAALGVFAKSLPSRKGRRWRKAVRRLTRALGHARDRDVQIDFLAERLAGVSVSGPCLGLAMLLGEVERERAACQPGLLEEIDRFDGSKADCGMRAMVRRALDQTPEESPDGDGEDLIAWAKAAIDEKLLAFLAFELCLGRPEDIEEHHAMRIAAKRLRYTMELLSPVFEGRLEHRIEAARRLQTFLGDLHDCDIWLERLGEFDGRFRKRRKRQYPRARGRGPWRVGLKYLGRACRNRRRRVFERLVARWPQLRDAVCGRDVVQEKPESPARPVGSPHHDAASRPETIHG